MEITMIRANVIKDMEATNLNETLW
jgi:hypothetical protein